MQIFKKIVEWRRKSPTQDTHKETASMTYNALTPTDEAKDCKAYKDALSWALKQNKNIPFTVSVK